MNLELPDLPYRYDALEPYIDEATMRLHHDKHHQAYVDKAIDALHGTELEGRPVEEILAGLDRLPDDRRAAVRNNVGGHANHTLFWRVMGGPGGPGPSGALADAIADRFGAQQRFVEVFSKAAMGVFGSGWTWLASGGDGLEVITTPNQDSPLMHGRTPILGLDVWEHAYYLTYQNRRADYIGAWWYVVDWNAVAERFSAVGMPVPAAS